MTRWTLAAISTAVIFFALAVSRSVYEATSPEWLTWHILLRKSYSIVAFTVVTFTFARALGPAQTRERAWLVCGYGAGYSAAIEVGQYLVGAREGLSWNAFDVACGALGGAIAVALDRRLARMR